MKKKNTKPTKAKTLVTPLVFNNPKGFKSLEEMLGLKKESDYVLTEFEEYKAWVSNLNLIDMQNHAITLGFRPSTDRPALIKLLLNEFNKRGNALTNVVNKKQGKNQNAAPRTIEELLKSKAPVDATPKVARTLQDIVGKNF